MAFFFPFSTLHELNLDWILDKVKTLTENNQEFNDKADYAVQTADEAKAIAEGAVLPDGGVTTPKIADYAVTQVKLAVSAVGNYQLQDGAVNENKLASDAVTTGKIADGNVTEDKLNSSLLNRIPLLSKIQQTFNDQNPCVITVPNNCRSLLFIFSSQASESCFISIYSTGSGSVKPDGLPTIPAIYTLTPTTNKLDIASSTAYNKTVFALRLSGDEMTPYTP